MNFPQHLQDFKKSSRLVEFYYDCRRLYHDIVFHVRVRVNRAIHGYDQYDVWEYASNVSKRAIVLLNKFKKITGTPAVICTCESFFSDKECDCGARTRWLGMLDDMIFYHTVVAGKYYDPDLHDIANYLFEMTNEDDKRRFRRGRYYYMKYYQSLWE